MGPRANSDGRWRNRPSHECREVGGNGPALRCRSTFAARCGLCELQVFERAAANAICALAPSLTASLLKSQCT